MEQIHAQLIAQAQCVAAPLVRLRLTVFRADGGLYTPKNNQIDWHIEAQPYAAAPADKTWRLCFAQGIAKAAGEGLNNCKTTSAALYVQAALQAQAKGCDEALIFNTLGDVCEATASNVFLLFRRPLRLLTPALSSGCVAGVLRACLLDLLRSRGICVQEGRVQVADLHACDEIWLTNALAGLRKASL